jgi:hypothetical protein
MFIKAFEAVAALFDLVKSKGQAIVINNGYLSQERMKK